jgi:hypothetical protein
MTPLTSPGPGNDARRRSPDSRVRVSLGLSRGLWLRRVVPEIVPLSWEDRTCPTRAEGTFHMQNIVRRPKVLVSGDGSGIVSHAGALLLTETARVTGLTAGLSARLRRWRAPRAVHDPGKIVLDLAVAVALGCDCLADAAVLRAEPALFGPGGFRPGDLAASHGRARANDSDRPGSCCSPAAGAAAGRQPGARLGQRADPRRHRRDHRDRPAATGPVSRWPSCCGLAMPGPALRPTTSPPPAPRWPSCPRPCGAGC